MPRFCPKVKKLQKPASGFRLSALGPSLGQRAVPDVRLSANASWPFNISPRSEPSSKPQPHRKLHLTRRVGVRRSQEAARFAEMRRIAHRTYRLSVDHEIAGGAGVAVVADIHPGVVAVEGVE